ncbi:MAG: macro domain-containing protein [Bacteroidales bacterium]|nr:macro domain-containing protein [Bacteroidales bacterium]
MIIHKKCDIFESGADIICHQVNCQGVMGSGVAKQVREKYPPVYRAYKEWCDKEEPEELLGKSQFVPLMNLWQQPKEDELLGIINIFGQLDYGYGKCHTDYDALKHAFERINLFIHLFEYQPIIAFPYKFGCARGGGDWNVVRGMIEEAFQDCMVFICECDKG